MKIYEKVITGSVLRVLNLMASMLIAFFMMPFLIHTLGDEQYGLWIVIGSLIGFYSFLDFGLSAAVGKYTSGAIGKGDYDYVNKIVNTALVLFGSLGCIVFLTAIIGAIVSYHMNIQNNVTISILFLILGANIGVQFPIRSFSGALTGQLRFDLLVYVDLFKLISRSSLIVIFVSNGFGLIAMASISLITEIVGNIFEIFLIRKYTSFISISRKYFNKSNIKQLLSYSWVAFIINVSELAKYKLIPIFVSGFIGLAAVVVYGIAIRLLEYFHLLLQNSVGFVMPLFSSIEEQHGQVMLKSAFIYMSIASTVISVFIGYSMYYYGNIFIVLWMGEKYINSYDLMMLMLIPIMMMTIQLPAKDLFFAVSKHHIMAIINIGELILFTLLVFVLSSDANTLSIAYAFVFGITGFELVKPYFTAKVLNTSMLEIYGLYLITIIKSITILAIYFYMLQFVTITSYIDILVYGIGQVIFFIGIGYFIFLPKKIKIIINSRLKLAN